MPSIRAGLDWYEERDLAVQRRLMARGGRLGGRVADGQAPGTASLSIGGGSSINDPQMSV